MNKQCHGQTSTHAPQTMHSSGMKPRYFFEPLRCRSRDGSISATSKCSPEKVIGLPFGHDLNFPSLRCFSPQKYARRDGDEEHP